MSCTLENRLARNFIKKSSLIRIIVTKPQYVFKVNLKEDSINNINHSSSLPNDSIALPSSLFLKNIEDSLFIANYFNSLKNELKKYNIRVYSDTLSDYIINSDSVTYLFTPSQMQIEEGLVKFEDKMLVDTTIYIQTFKLNNINLCVWFEVSTDSITGNLTSTELKQVVFAENSATDIINGNFQSDIFGKNITYRYRRKNLEMKDIYHLAGYAGIKHAEYMFDYMMNHYISSVIHSQYSNILIKRKISWYHYNRNFNYLIPAHFDRFIPLTD